jgi:hypothetical protein
MPPPLIERYETEILDMLHRDTQQADILREFKSRGVDIPSSSLSDFAKRVKSTEVITAKNGGIAPWFDAMMHLQRATTEELTGRMAAIIEGLQQLKQEGDERFEAVKAFIDKPPAKHDAGDVGVLSARMEEAIQRIDALASRTAGAGLRWVWLKAFLWASGLWALALLGVVAYLGGVL